VNVLVFTTLFPNNVWPSHGVFIKERTRQVAGRDGVTVRVVAPVPYFPPIRLSWRHRFAEVARQEEIEGLPVHHPRFLMMPKVGMATYGWTLFLSVLPFLSRLARQHPFDLIDAHYLFPDAFAAVELGRALGKPVIVSARGSDVNLFAQFPLVRRCLLRTLRRADRVVAVSGALRARLAALGVAAERVTVIPNGVDGTKFRPMSRAEARAKLGLDGGPYLLAVGHLVALKGFDLVIESLARLRAGGNCPDLRLLVVGEGGERAPLEALARRLGVGGAVRFAGPLSHPELRTWYNAADVFCLASSREGWPNVVLEALACGTPVVATRVGGIPEIVTSDSVGLLAERSPEALAGAIEEALRRTWDREVLVRHARGHGWEQTASRVLEEFRLALGGQRRS